MVDPFTAISLAGTIVEFIDFGRKVINGGTQIYRSIDGALPWVAELEYVTNEFSRLSSSLGIEPVSQAAQTSPEEESLRQLATRCRLEADSLLNVLRTLKLNTSGKKGAQMKWKSLQQAMKTIWKGKEITEHSQRLNDLRSQFQLNLIALLGSKQSSVASKLDKISASHRQCEVNSSDSLDLLKTQILDELKAMKSSTFSNVKETEIRTRLEQLNEVGERMQRQVHVLSGLHFSRMRQRHSAIKEAHSQTFQWIFSEEKDDTKKNKTSVHFVDWLRSREGIFWISGKAGSGKSTLMKFLSGHPSTDKILKSWAGNKTLVKTSFYFWNPGSELQKSQEGLFQSLLYGILRRVPELIPIVCEQRYHDSMPSLAGSEPWTRAELLAAFSTLQFQAIGANRFCLFVDGLDEYAGDHLEIIEVMRNIASTPGIKLCVASRPWNIFNKAFGSHASNMLMLHELTQEDIQLYVKNNFEENADIAQKIDEDSEFQSFTQEIVERAEGVFLWVFLVVRSLIRGASEGDEVRDFQRRLREVPSDLETYFKQMLNSVEKVYHVEAARIYLICLSSPEPPSVMTISYFDHLDTGFDHSSSTKLTSEVARSACKKAQVRINARCKDLLEFRGLNTGDDNLGPLAKAVSYPKVEFLHRTVRDFLETPDMQFLLINRASLAFNPDEFLANANLAQVVCLAQHNGVAIYQGLVDDFLYHAHRIESSHDQAVISILDYLEDAIPPSATKRIVGDFIPFDDDGNWTLSLAVQRQLPLYVKYKLRCHSPDLRPNQTSKLLYYALERPSTSKYSWDMDTDILNNLLDAGADPNYPLSPVLDQSSIWRSWLRKIDSERQSWGRAQYQQELLAAEALLRNGVNAEDIALPKNPKNTSGSLSTEIILKLIFRPEDSERLLVLVRQNQRVRQNWLSNGGGDGSSKHHFAGQGERPATVDRLPIRNEETSTASRRQSRWKWFGSR